MARVVWKDGKPMAITTVYSDPATEQAEAAVLAAFKRAHPDHRPWTGPVMLRFTAIFEVPPSWPEKVKRAALTGRLYHTTKPDKDNIEKLITDALNGHAWADDGQCQGGGVKRYGSPARVEVELTSLADASLPPTPIEKSAERRVAEGKPLRAAAPKRRNSAKAKSDTPLQRRIDAALARDAGRT